MTVDELLQRLRDDGVRIVVGGFIRPRDFAALVDRDLRTLRRWRERDYGPPVHRIGKSPLYAVSEISEFLMSTNVRDREPETSTASPTRTHARRRIEPCSHRRRSS